MAGITYVRLCPQLASDIRLDETSDEVCRCYFVQSNKFYVNRICVKQTLMSYPQVLVEMLWRSQAYMHEQRDQVNLLVKLLEKTTS